MFLARLRCVQDRKPADFFIVRLLAMGGNRSDRILHARDKFQSNLHFFIYRLPLKEVSVKPLNFGLCALPYLFADFTAEKFGLMDDERTVHEKQGLLREDCFKSGRSGGVGTGMIERSENTRRFRSIQEAMDGPPIRGRVQNIILDSDHLSAIGSRHCQNQF